MIHIPNYATARSKYPPMRVFLDDVEQKYVTAYNIAQGWIEVAAIDNNGYFVAKRGEFISVRKTGTVRVEWI